MIAIILGTRPEIIKMSPIIRACEALGEDYFTLHTGQHYSYDMDRASSRTSNCLSQSTTSMSAQALMPSRPERSWPVSRRSCLRKPGSSSSRAIRIRSLQALAASKLHIKVVTWRQVSGVLTGMPEEINRVVADHISDLLFPPTETAKKNLIEEGIPEEKIFVTGNTIVDAVEQNLAIARRKGDLLQQLCLTAKGFFLVTAHRAENVDHKQRLEGILQGLEALRDEFSLPIVFPMHPRTAKMVQAFGLSPDGICVTKPLGYLDFLQLEANARLVLTDSGGLQEESCILGVPCVTLRDNTERPETVEVGANALAGIEPDVMLSRAREMLVQGRSWANPFGDGEAGERIVQEVLKCS